MIDVIGFYTAGSVKGIETLRVVGLGNRLY
jgi:hypothetical protein